MSASRRQKVAREGAEPVLVGLDGSQRASHGAGVRGQEVLAVLGLGSASVEANPKGYNFSVHVTKGHEREAMEAQRRKKPSRIGKFVLKMLGFKGEAGSDYIK